MLLEGQRIDRYRIVRLLGSGGMGDVYLAEDARIGQQVAIKVIRAEVSPYPGSEGAREAARLFEREAKAIAKLDHPNILPLFDYGEERVGEMTLIYLVMPYRQEGSLMKWLRQRQQAELLPPLEVASIIRQAADALQHAHNRQIIHQDVKPSNFLLRYREGTLARPDVLLTDFGIATITTGTASASQAVRGTPTYMAPEQCRGHAVPASDQYALAVMAYELLTGRPPFQGGTIQMMYQHMHEPPQPPSTLNSRLSKEMDIVLLCALAKQPEQRFASISAFANAFQQAAQGIQAADVPTQVTLPGVPASISEIHTVLAISEEEAQAGTRRTVTLPGGQHITVPVPAGVEDGHILRLEGQGGPSNDGTAATLILTIVVKPEKATPPLSTPIVVDKPALTPNIVDAPLVSTASAQPTASSVDASVVQAPTTPLMPSNPPPEHVVATEYAGPPIPLWATSSATLPEATSPVMPPPEVLTPVTPLPGSPRRRGGARRWVALALALFVVLLVTVGGIALANPGLFGFHPQTSSTPSPLPGTQGVTATPVPVTPGSAVVTITPVQKQFEQSYAITEVTGTPDPAQNQVQGVHVYSSTQSQSSQATATGSGQTSGTNASGTLTLSQPSQAVTIPAGTQFTGASGVTVATRAAVSLSLGSSVQVGAYALQPGSSGNIPAYDINYTATYNGVNFYVQNPAAFSGGQSGQSYPVLLQSDIDAAAQAIAGQVTQSAQNGLGTQLQANEQFIGNAQCTPQTSSNYAAGAHVSSATVTVQVTCQQEAYNPQPALTMASNLLKQDIPKKLGASYAPVGNVLTTVTQTTPGNGTVTISIDAKALAVFQFSATQLQNLAGQIAGKSEQDAQAFLSQQPGVLKATIMFASGDGKTLPTDTKKITIQVEKVQGLQA